MTPFVAVGSQGRTASGRLHSRLQPSAPVDLHVTDVLDQLDRNRLAIEELSREVGGIIEIGGFSREYAPAVSLDREIVERMAQYVIRLECRDR